MGASAHSGLYVGPPLLPPPSFVSSHPFLPYYVRNHKPHKQKGTTFFLLKIVHHRTVKQRTKRFPEKKNVIEMIESEGRGRRVLRCQSMRSHKLMKKKRKSKIDAAEIEGGGRCRRCQRRGCHRHRCQRGGHCRQAQIEEGTSEEKT